MRQVQADFDKQYEITKLLLEGMSTVQVNCQFLIIDLFVFALCFFFILGIRNFPKISCYITR